MRFSAVISHPIQHYSPVFTELSTRKGWEVKVFYLSDQGVRRQRDSGFGQSIEWDVPLVEGHDHEFLKPGLRLEDARFWNTGAKSLARRLDGFRPHLVWLHGYAHLANWLALLWVRSHARSMFFSDSELLRDRTPLRKTLKRLPVQWFFRQCDAFMSIGDNNEAYYRHYGVKAEKIFRGACPVEMSRFNLPNRVRQMYRRDTRRKLGIPERALVLAFSGKFQDYKRPLDLIDALNLLVRDHDIDVHGLFIGEGPQRSAMEHRVAACGLGARVHLTGFINQSEMPKYLASADIMTVTSQRDAHPLSVTEALPYGMPVITSDRVGCVGPTDTARPGDNALVYRCGDVRDLAQKALVLLTDRDLMSAMGQKSLEIAPTQNVTAAADAVERIADSLYRSCQGNPY